MFVTGKFYNYFLKKFALNLDLFNYFPAFAKGGGGDWLLGTKVCQYLIIELFVYRGGSSLRHPRGDN